MDTIFLADIYLLSLTETPEQCMKFVQSERERHQSDVSYVVLVSLLLTKADFTLWSGVPINDSEQENACWVDLKLILKSFL